MNVDFKSSTGKLRDDQWLVKSFVVWAMQQNELRKETRNTKFFHVVAKHYFLYDCFIQKAYKYLELKTKKTLCHQKEQ